MMKKLFLLLFTCLLVCFTACRATPENEIIKYASEEQYDADAVEQSVNDTILKNVPQTLKKSFSAYGEKLTVELDAEVIAEYREAWPVYRTKLYYFTQEDVDRFAARLFDENTTFYSNNHNNAVSTKWDCMKKIEEYQKAVDAIRAGSTDYPEEIEYYQIRIDELTEMLPEMPESAEKVSAEPILEEIDSSFDYMDVYTETDDQTRKRFFVSNERPYGGRFMYAEASADHFLPVSPQYDKLIPAVDTVIEKIEKSEETAIAEAETFLEKRGIEGMEYSGTVCGYGTLQDFATSTYYHTAHGVVFTRVFNDMPRALAEDDYVVVDIGEDETGQYSMSMANESLTIVVDEEGVKEMHWEHPDEIVRVENDNVRLLPFEKIENALADALKVRYAYVEDENVSQNHITVKKVRLNYAKINVKDDFNEYRIAPAWFFYDENDKVVLILNATDMSTIAS